MINGNVRTVEASGLCALEEALRVLGGNILLLFEKIAELRFDISVNHHRYMDLAIKLERLSKELEAIQKAGDEAIVRMPQIERKQCKKQVPIFLKMFGWCDRIDDHGNIIYDA